MSELTLDRLATITDTAEILGVPYSSLYYQVLKGNITRHEVGRKAVLIDVENARAIMASLHTPQKRKGNK